MILPTTSAEVAVVLWRGLRDRSRQPLGALFLVAAQPHVEGMPADTEVAAGLGIRCRSPPRRTW